MQSLGAGMVHSYFDIVSHIVFRRSLQTLGQSVYQSLRKFFYLKGFTPRTERTE